MSVTNGKYDCSACHASGDVFALSEEIRRRFDAVFDERMAALFRALRKSG